jgi:DNA repair exonuclease SbcCD nuclease subunit
VKEYKDGNHLYCGHFSIKESVNNYDAKLSKEAFKEYIYVFLGHIHSYQLIKPNIVHLGSCRYVNFNEVEDKQKIVALITDYGTETEKVHFMKLKSPIPMIQLELGIKNEENVILDPHNEALEVESSKTTPINPPISRQNMALSELIVFLDKTDPKTKIKVKIMDFESFREFLPLVNRYSSKFHLFKYQTEFTVIPDKGDINAKTETINFRESFKNWIEQQKLDDRIKEILLNEIK